MNAFLIDAFAFARQKELREGELALSQLSRLAAECAAGDGKLNWAVQGGTHAVGVPQMRLQLQGEVHLVCQRCLQQFAFHLESEALLVLAKDDEHADELEELIDDDSVDVIVGSNSMNLLDLVEDEALLALPLSPRHKVCPDNSLLESVQAEKELPFAVLQGLKKIN